MEVLELWTPIGLISNIYSIHEDILSYAWNNVDVDFHTTVDGGGIQGLDSMENENDFLS